MSTIQHPPGAGGEQPSGGRGADPTAAGDAFGGFEIRLLAALRMVVAEQAATAGQEASPADRRTGMGTVRRPAAARGPARRAWPTRRLAMTGGLAASLAAVLAATVTLTTVGGARPPTRNPVTAVGVLNNAALAALREPARTPSPGQFIYYKTYAAFKATRPPGHPEVPALIQGTGTYEAWASVSGTHRGLQVETVKYRTGGHTSTLRGPTAWCAHGYIHPAYVIKVHCIARYFADYLPQLPATAAGMRAFLDRQLHMSNDNLAKLIGDGPGGPVNVLSGAFYILTQYYLTPAQQAAMYHALATFPGLTAVAKVTSVQGEVGVGVRYHSPAKSITWTAIFDPTTFKPIGADVDWLGHHTREAVLVPPTIVSKVGQRP